MWSNIIITYHYSIFYRTVLLIRGCLRAGWAAFLERVIDSNCIIQLTIECRWDRRVWDNLAQMLQEPAVKSVYIISTMIALQVGRQNNWAHECFGEIIYFNNVRQLYGYEFQVNLSVVLYVMWNAFVVFFNIWRILILFWGFLHTAVTRNFVNWITISVLMITVIVFLLVAPMYGQIIVQIILPHLFSQTREDILLSNCLLS